MIPTSYNLTGVKLKNVKWIDKLLGSVGLSILRKSFGIILLAIAIKLFRSNTHL
jgi:multiple antibiotic resistance protein